MLDGASKIVLGDIVSGLYTNDLAFVAPSDDPSALPSSTPSLEPSASSIPSVPPSGAPSSSPNLDPSGSASQEMFDYEQT